MRRYIWIPPSQSGFTLLELLIALFIFAVGILGIAGLQWTSISQNSNSNTRSVAVTVAQGALEEILAKNDDDVLFDADDTGAYDLDPATAATTLQVLGAGTYSATRRITVGTPSADMVRVDVTISGPQGRTVTLTGFKRAL